MEPARRELMCRAVAREQREDAFQRKDRTMITERLRRTFVIALVGFVAVAGRASSASAQVTYVAFAQSGGFDANGAWGMGSSRNQGTAIGTALRECQARSLFCGSEGDCALRPGMFVAFASDGKVAGNRGLACNYATAALATSTALSWCGAGCRVLYSGGAANTVSENRLDGLEPPAWASEKPFFHPAANSLTTRQ
jgi:hypothetical protein